MCNYQTAKNLAGICLVLMLTLFAFGAMARAQTPTPTPTPDSQTPDYTRRRIAPTIGTGGAVGGPTGLFTVYDGKTLHKKDFTFSLSYNNYHRDPGQASIALTQFTFNYGLRDKIELFFNTEVYRGIKVYNPALLSSFYLPNSQFSLAANQLGTGAALVLSPLNNQGVSGALFRPAGNQPFVQFPFVGQPSGNFGLPSPPFSGTLGVQANNNSGAANNFPGIGSVFGSILPGVVLPPTTTSAANLAQQTTSLAPSYLPDAPFINRAYGESSLNSFVIGAKIRFRKQESLTNFGVLPFYRFYADTANDQSGFNMLQRGASPGGNRGDFGLVGFFASRVGPYANISFNAGYVVNSSPTSSLFGTQRAILLDRPDEFIYGFGVDYSYYNDQFGDYQPMFEIRGTKYVGGRTPNAFEHDPIDLIVGSRFYLPLPIPVLDNIGFAVAYRRHLNPQGNTGNNLSLNAFNPLSNANGFIVQLWAGRDKLKDVPGAKGGLLLPLPQPGQAALNKIVLPCPPNQEPRAGSCPVPNPLVMKQQFTAQFADEDGNPMPFGKDPDKELDESLLTWVSTGGTRVVPERGSKTVLWDLTGAAPGIYELTALYPDYQIKNRKPVKVGDTELKFMMPVEACDCVDIVIPTPCPASVTVTNPPSVFEGTPAPFTVNVVNPPAGASISYSWEVSAGQIIGSRDTPSITVDTTGLGGQTITATVTLGGLSPECANTAQGNLTTARNEIIVDSRSVCKLFDRYGAITYNDEKARLDNFVIALNEDRLLDGYLIAYEGGTQGRSIGTRRQQVTGVVPAGYRINRALEYIRASRGYTKQVESLNGGRLPESTVVLYLCPVNAVRPSPTPDPNAQLIPTPQTTQSPALTMRRKAHFKQRRKRPLRVIGS